MASPPCSPSLSPQPHVLTLPAEVRIRIYARLLVRTIPTTFPTAHPELPPLTELDANKNPKRPSTVFPNILRTCTRINSEAGHFLYTQNHANFRTSYSVIAWLCTMDSYKLSGLIIPIALLHPKMGPLIFIIQGKFLSLAKDFIKDVTRGLASQN